MELRSRVFTAPNGEKRTLYFRDGTNDESTIIACFEQDFYKFLEHEYDSNDVFLDLGSDVGAVSVLFSTLPTRHRIIAVEPLPENCEVIRENASENNVDIVLYEKALWVDSNSKVNVFYADDSESGKVHKYMGGINMADPLSKGTGNKYVTVSTINLEQIFTDNKIESCGFLKMDIEGAEERLFSNLPLPLLDRMKFITGEYHNADFNSFFPFSNMFDIEQGEAGSFFFRRKDAIK